MSRETTEEVKLKFIDEVFRIESRTSADEEGASDGEGVARTNRPDCDRCKDNPRRKCKFCACSVCGGKNDPDKQILCDECDMAYHLWCLQPKLDAVPEEDDW
jgi:E3 ubiquitin-protein ligase UHRF1